MRLMRRVLSAFLLVGLSAPVGLDTAANAAPVSVGHLAYITGAGELDLVGVLSDGSTSAPERLGPVTTVSTPESVKAQRVVASGDGKLLAWQEIISRPDATYGTLQTGARITLRNMTTGHTVTMRSEDYPLGFAGHTLVVIGAHTKRLVMKPAPHFVTIHDGGAYGIAAYPHGIVDVTASVGGSNATVERDRLRLASFHGQHTLLHRYKVGSDYRSAAANVDATSPDGTKLLVERGNHQDFDGLGPSSLFDTYALTARHARHRLGHYGTNSAKWRLWQATFVGPHDQPWLALHSAPGTKASGYHVRGVVVAYTGGRWKLESSHGIAVAGNPGGYVVIQGGTWDRVQNSPDGEYTTTTTFEALLEGPHGISHTLTGIRATELVWAG